MDILGARSPKELTLRDLCTRWPGICNINRAQWRDPHILRIASAGVAKNTRRVRIGDMWADERAREGGKDEG